MMRPLAEAHIGCLVYGSIARGDIHPKSDVDVYVPNPPMPTLVESALERAGVKPSSRLIVKATPTAAAKGYLVVEEGRSYSFPLETPRGFEAEFPRFAGCLGLEELEEEALALMDEVEADAERLVEDEKEHLSRRRRLEAELAELKARQDKLAAERIRAVQNDHRDCRCGACFGCAPRPGLRRRTPARVSCLPEPPGCLLTSTDWYQNQAFMPPRC